MDNQDSLDHRDRLGQPVNLVNEEMPEVKGQLDYLDNLEARVQEETQVPPAHLDRLDPKDQLGQQELVGPLGHEGILVHKAPQVHQDPRELQGLQEALALLDPSVTKDQTDHQDHKGLPVQEEVPDHKEQLAELDLKDQLETLAQQEVKVNQDQLERVEMLDQLVSKVKNVQKLIHSYSGLNFSRQYFYFFY